MNIFLRFLSIAEVKSDFIEQLKLSDWNIIIKQGRASGMLGILHNILEKKHLLSQVPERPRLHLLSARIMADRQTEKVNWEIKNIHKILERTGIPIIILKGAAYSFTSLAPSNGRMFGDIDIMVPHGAILDAENSLKRSGWITSHQNEYDDKYYRRWMHEIPPLVHRTRQTVLDIHHNILPLTAKLKPQAKDLWNNVVNIEGYDDLYLMSKQDMILHSATHLFQEGEFDRSLRDLYDISQLIEQFRHGDDFWETLYARAEKLDLVLPLIYSLRYAHKIFGIYIPQQHELAIKSKLPSEIHFKLMDNLFTNALYPIDTSKTHLLKAMTDWMLYIRGHYLRMPLHLLIPHLIYKATLAKRDEKKMSEKKENMENLLQNFLNQ